MSIDITLIPSIMRANKWPKGAALMDGWFARMPSVAPAYGAPDVSTITMEWVLGFKRARAVYDEMIDQRIWANTAARGQLRDYLRRIGANAVSAKRFGEFAAPVPSQDRNSVNFRVVGFNVLDNDDLAMALGRFTFKLVVAGQVRLAPKAEQMEVSIDEVGVYVRDQYDFDGEQDLGYWNPVGNRFSMWYPGAGDKVTNKTFRDWRTAHGRGGDFIIFSDLLRSPLRRPDVFQLPR